MPDEANIPNAPPKKSLSTLGLTLIVAAALAGIYFWQNHDKVMQALNKNVDVNVAPPTPAEPVIPVPAPLQTIRVAAWDLTPLDFKKLSDTNRANQIVETLMGFDLVAIQGISMRNTIPMDELVRLLETKGKHYTYAINPESFGRFPEYMAFLFNKETIRIDQETLVEVIDTSLSYRPLVANFCTANPHLEKAFTFVLISVKIDQERQDFETKALGNLYRTIRNQRSNEDDIILLGNLGAPVRTIDSLATVPNLVAVHPDYPTTADSLNSLDNILFDKLKTTEYVEQAGVFDLMAKFSLKIADIYPLAAHLPVWADFSVFESGRKN